MSLFTDWHVGGVPYHHYDPTVNVGIGTGAGEIALVHALCNEMIAKEFSDQGLTEVWWSEEWEPVVSTVPHKNFELRTEIRFCPDMDLFEVDHFPVDMLDGRLKELAALRSDLRIEMHGHDLSFPSWEAGLEAVLPPEIGEDHRVLGSYHLVATTPLLSLTGALR